MGIPAVVVWDSTFLMPRKPTKPEDAEQSKRFIETAEEVGATDDDALERAFKKIISHPKKGKESPN
jgi:hypothetical protein